MRRICVGGVVPAAATAVSILVFILRRLQCPRKGRRPSPQFRERALALSLMQRKLAEQERLKAATTTAPPTPRKSKVRDRTRSDESSMTQGLHRGPNGGTSGAAAQGPKDQVPAVQPGGGLWPILRPWPARITTRPS